ERADAAAAAAKSAGERADAAAAAAKQVAQSAQAAAQSAVQRSDLDALQSRIAALERRITDVGNAAAQQQRPGTDDRAARAALAAAALRDAVERGAPYQTELPAMKALGTPQAATAALEPFATSGVPSAASLAHELAQLTPSLQHAAGAAPAQTSFLGRIEDNAKNLVRVTPVDAPAGDDPAAVIARLNVHAAHSDLAAALADIARLPQPAQTLAAPWVQKVNARNTALAAARRISADALAGLGKSDSQ
ncbi:MAG TPA: mitofilin family membrane protein, partial [Stellaceae bacterium]|nr:mitofilin family membrane protein [Stellaceae bacterium]